GRINRACAIDRRPACFCVGSGFGESEAWIPDTRRFASLAGELENDDILFWQQPVSQRRRSQWAPASSNTLSRVTHMAGYYSRTPEDEASGEDPYFQRLKGWYREDVAKAARWRRQAREDFQFRDGDQWSPEDRRLLEEQGRPAIVFNRIGVLVDAVVGAEVGNRREVRYIPRESGDSLPNEVLTSAAEWFRDQCDAEDEESAAFKDAI